jgi:hypothetical protein
LGGCEHHNEPQQRSPDRIVRKGLSNSDAFPVDRDTYQPDTNPPEISHFCVLELSVTVRTQDEQVAWVMADLGIKMMYFEVWLAVPFLESERTKLTLPIMQFSKQNANRRGHILAAPGRNRRYPWTRLVRRLLSDAQQFLLGQLSWAPFGQSRKRTELSFGIRIRPGFLKFLSGPMLFTLLNIAVQSNSV